MRVSPLLVAGIAAALLLVVLGVDATLDRSYRLDVREGQGWRTLAASGPPEGFRPPASTSQNGSLHLRLSVENDWPFPLAEDFAVLANGFEVARGRIEAPARGVGEVAFDVDPATFDHTLPPEGPRAEPEMVYLHLEVVVGGERLYGSLSVRGAGA